MTLGSVERPERVAEALLGMSRSIRYAAVSLDGTLVMRAAAGRRNASSAESDQFEELLVNPTLLAITGARGAIDCGGLRFLVVAYPAFFALVVPMAGGHATVSLPRSADPVALASAVDAVLRSSEG